MDHCHITAFTYLRPYFASCRNHNHDNGMVVEVSRIVSCVIEYRHTNRRVKSSSEEDARCKTRKRAINDSKNLTGRYEDKIRVKVTTHKLQIMVLGIKQSISHIMLKQIVNFEQVAIESGIC